MLDALGRGWRWWLSELAFLLPQKLRRIGHKIRVIQVEPQALVILRQTGAQDFVAARLPRDASAAALAAAMPAAQGWGPMAAEPAILHLPAADTLQRRLRLPRAARSTLGAILHHEMARQSPLDARDIYYDYRVVGQDGGMIDIVLRIVRRGPVDALLRLCAEAGLPIAAVGFAGDGAPADGGTFPADPAAAGDLRRQARLVPAAAALLLLAAALLCGGLYLQGEVRLAALEDQIETLRPGAMAVGRIQAQLTAARNQQSFLAAQKRNPATVALLARVAALLPDDAWLYEFERNGDEVRLHGFSASAASLIALFDASPYFADAQFRAPLMQGVTPGVQRFDISFRLRRGGT